MKPKTGSREHHNDGSAMQRVCGGLQGNAVPKSEWDRVEANGDGIRKFVNAIVKHGEIEISWDCEIDIDDKRSRTRVEGQSDWKVTTLDIVVPQTANYDSDRPNSS